MRKITALIATSLVAFGLVAGTAGAASAETLYRPAGSSKVTIKPSTKGVPSGATVTSKKITVKKGSKTVAKNKSSYKAKKGKYKVTSTVKYKTKKRHYIADPIITANCVVSSAYVPTTTVWVDGYYDWNWIDNGYYDDYGYWVDTSGYDEVWVPGYSYEGYGNDFDSITVSYTGRCTDWYWVNGDIKWITWDTGWTEDAYAYDGGYEDAYYVGDTMWVGNSNDVTVDPYYTGWSSTKTLKTTRTVTVR